MLIHDRDDLLVAEPPTRRNKPRVHMVDIDIDAAASLVDAARAKYRPEVVAEGRARVSNDLDRAEDETNDLQARLVLRWNLYRGVDKANEQEQSRRVNEQRLAPDTARDRRGCANFMESPLPPG